MVYKQWRQYIVAGKTSQLIESLLEAPEVMNDPHHREMTLVLSGRLQASSRNFSLGLQTLEAHEDTVAQINQALSRLIDELEANASDRAATKAKPGYGLWFFLLLVPLLTVGLWWWAGSSEGAEQTVHTNPAPPPPGLTSGPDPSSSTTVQSPAVTSGPAAAVEVVVPQGVPSETSERVAAAKGDEFSRTVRLELAGQALRVGRYEVTVEQYWNFCVATGRRFPHGKVDTGQWSKPMRQVSWRDAEAYCQYVGGRLPTEGEWSWLARGGDQTKGYAFSGGDDSLRVGWWRVHRLEAPQPVGGKVANELGLFDMSGNVAEWCADRGRAAGTRVVKGGSWSDFHPALAPGHVNFQPEGMGTATIGFRVVFDE
ncbi:MAG: SUMF1/EgtB/PvdO family nonheme iron enzyme [Bacteroidota bacterium]